MSGWVRQDGRHDERPPFARIAASAAAKHGLVTTAELHALGLTDSSISRASASGRLGRITAGLYRVPPYPPTWEQSVMAAVLAGPPGTVASHRSAARLHGFRGCRSDLVEITCRRWRREQRPSVVHESLAHDGRDTVVVNGIPVTDIARTIVDLGAVMYPAALGLALDEARRRGQVDLTAVERRLEERAARGRNGITVVRELVDERQGRLLTSTGFENLLLEVIERYGLPRPELQWPIVDRGFTAFLDFAYPSSLVAIEADSEEYHLDLETFHRDRARQNRISLMGWTFLRYTGRHLRNEPRTVARQIAAALGMEF